MLLHGHTILILSLRMHTHAHTHTPYFSEPSEIALEASCPEPQRVQCVFPKNKYILLGYHGIVDKLKNLLLLLSLLIYYYLLFPLIYIP